MKANQTTQNKKETKGDKKIMKLKIDYHREYNFHRLPKTLGTLLQDIFQFLSTKKPPKKFKVEKYRSLL